MKNLKTYEELNPEYSIYKVGNYIIWNDEKSWEICEIVTRVNHIIKVKDLLYLEDNKLKFAEGDKSNIDLSSDEERNAIKYVSNNFDDCVEKIKILVTINKYNI